MYEPISSIKHMQIIHTKRYILFKTALFCYTYISISSIFTIVLETYKLILLVFESLHRNVLWRFGNFSSIFIVRTGPTSIHTFRCNNFSQNQVSYIHFNSSIFTVKTTTCMFEKQFFHELINCHVCLYVSSESSVNIEQTRFYKHPYIHFDFIHTFRFEK